MNAHIHQAPQTSARITTSEFCVDAALERVEHFMRELARRGGLDRTAEMAADQLSTGGKRVRARLALASARAFGVAEEHAVAWAACVELLHNATLVHDDIQDGDTTRRGKPTIWAKYGAAQAINAGDFLLMLPFLCLSDLPAPARGELSTLVAEYATRIVRGQADELSQEVDGSTTVQQYIRAVEGKTGALLALPVVGAAVLAGRCPRDAERVGAPFVQLGVLFQLQDDLIDMFGDKGRGTIGGDVYEGKNSALLVTLCAHAAEAGRTVSEIVRRPRSSTSLTDIERVREIYETHHVVELVVGRILQIRDQVLGSTLLIQEPQLHSLAGLLVQIALAPLQHLIEETFE